MKFAFEVSLRFLRNSANVWNNESQNDKYLNYECLRWPAVSCTICQDICLQEPVSDQAPKHFEVSGMLPFERRPL